MGGSDLLTHFIKRSGQRRFDNHSLDALFGFKGEIRFAQTFVPGNRDAGFTGKGAGIIPRLTWFFEKGDTSAVVWINILCELLGF